MKIGHLITNRRFFMRQIINFNRKWAFTKQTTEIPAVMPTNWDFVNIPHSWNAIDGQDGDNDYFRGTCCYARSLSRAELPAAEKYYLQIQGANSSADVYLNGKHLAHHDGGYSIWRVDLTQALEAENQQLKTKVKALEEELKKALERLGDSRRF